MKISTFLLKLLCKSRLPSLDGNLKISGLDSNIKISRDKWGIPHILAQGQSDLFFAQGFVHAQDRLWQMEFNRRLVAGRLSEILGKPTVSLDRWLRTLRMYHVASLEKGLLEDKTINLLQAYADGINYFIKNRKLPIEFLLLRYKPEPWKIVDTLAWIKMMSWSLSVNWEAELLRAKLIETIGADLASELELPHLIRWPYIIPPGTDVSHINLQTKKENKINGSNTIPSPHEGLGSNNWVISKDKTASGCPLLSNDMHLPLSIPSIWYENHLIANDLNVNGVTFPGIPGVISGHNGKVAWGFTNGFADVQDLYIEKLQEDPDGNILYECNGKWEKAEIINEQINVRGHNTEIETVVITRHGPIINNLAEELRGNKQLALKWTSLEPNTMIEGLFDMMTAKSCQEFHLALKKWVAPVQNVVYADSAGNIGYTYAGKIPIRAKGNGQFPVPGWSDEYNWVGYTPFEQLPHLLNPPQGYIVTANNRTVPEDYPVRIDIEPISGDRAQRIAELLIDNNQEKINIEYIKMMQYDQLSTSARVYSRYIANLKIKPNEPNPKIEKAIALIKHWDGRLNPDNPAATIYKVHTHKLIRTLLDSKFQSPASNLENHNKDSNKTHDLVERVMGKGPTPILAEISVFGEYWLPWLLSKLEDQESHWFDIGNGEKRDDILYKTLLDTVLELEEEFGPHIQNWEWGRIHKLKFTHALGASKSISKLFNRGPYPIGGDHTTIFATGTYYHTLNHSPMIGPPFRMIIDLGDFNNSLGMLIPGQSGNPASRHYDDQIGDWFIGNYHPMVLDIDNIEQDITHLLNLLPVE